MLYYYEILNENGERLDIFTEMEKLKPYNIRQRELKYSQKYGQDVKIKFWKLY